MPNTQTINCDHDIPRVSYKQAQKGLDTRWSCGPKRPSKNSLKGSVHKYRRDPLGKYRSAKYSQFRIVRPQAKAEESLEQRFQEQADKWRRETEHLSSPAQMMMHPSYQAILGMAQGREQEVVRLMLIDLRDNRAPWFWALSYLTHENPIQRSEAGKLNKMIRAWVDWGKAQGRI